MIGKYQPSDAQEVDNFLLEAALGYARWGLPVLPCNPNNKAPLTPHGFKDATTDERQIRAWWRRYRGAMIGIPTGPQSGIDAIDIDSKSEEGMDGYEHLPNWKVLSPVIVSTPRAGAHLWFRSEGKVRCTTSLIAPGVDTRGVGGYLIVPPSEAVNGGCYKFRRPADEYLGNRSKLPSFPADLLARLGHKYAGWGGDTPTADPTRVAAAMAVAPNPDLGHDEWKIRGMAIHRATDGSEDGFEIFDKWSQKSAKYEPPYTREAWDAITRSPPDRIGAGSIFFWADEANPSWNRSAADVLVDELAQLSPAEYESRRRAAAEQLGWRIGVLDTKVADRRAELTAAAEPQPAWLQPIEPWPEPVDGHNLVCDLAKAADRHIVMPHGHSTAIALWVLHAHVHNVAQHSPILYISSPTKRCGKTNLLSLLSMLVPRPLSAANVTPATVFRAIERWHPTLLIDEMDTFLSDQSDLRGVLNSGHNRATAFVLRCVGDDLIPTQFSTWAPKVFASIGRIHTTLEDRAIPIVLKRKLRSESVERLPKQTDAYRDLLRKGARWADDHSVALSKADPALPDLNDRARDNWEPLLAIAEACSAECARVATRLALALAGDDEDNTYDIQLLGDLRDLFDAEQEDVVLSRRAAELLAEDPEKPWANYRHGKPITQRQLARLLAPFGITSGEVHPKHDRHGKGYKRADCEEAWRRYLPRQAGVHPRERANPSTTEVSDAFASARSQKSARIENDNLSYSHRGSRVRADKPPAPRAGREKYVYRGEARTVESILRRSREAEE